MRALKFITGHVIYNPAYTYLQIPTENHPSEICVMQRVDVNKYLFTKLQVLSRFKCH